MEIHEQRLVTYTIKLQCMLVKLSKLIIPIVYCVQTQELDHAVTFADVLDSIHHANKGKDPYKDKKFKGCCYESQHHITNIHDY